MCEVAIGKLTAEGTRDQFLDIERRYTQIECYTRADKIMRVNGVRLWRLRYEAHYS